MRPGGDCPLPGGGVHHPVSPRGVLRLLRGCLPASACRRGQGPVTELRLGFGLPSSPPASRKWCSGSGTWGGVVRSSSRASWQLWEEPTQPVLLLVPPSRTARGPSLLLARAPSLLPTAHGLGPPLATGCGSASERVPGAWPCWGCAVRGGVTPVLRCPHRRWRGITQPRVSCRWLPEWETLCPGLRAGGEGPTARMIGKDFLAKLLSRWIYPGLVLVDSGTFSLLSRFLFMTCHLLQQARREPLASSSRSGCRSGTRRHRSRQLLAPFQERCRGLAGHPCPPLLPVQAGAASLPPACAAGLCLRCPPRLPRAGGVGRGRGRRSWQLPAGGGGCCASDMVVGFITSVNCYSDHLQCVRWTACGPAGGSAARGRSGALSPLPSQCQDGQCQESARRLCQGRAVSPALPGRQPWQQAGEALPPAPESRLHAWFLPVPGGPSALLITHGLITAPSRGGARRFLRAGCMFCPSVISPVLVTVLWGGVLADPSVVAACAEGQWWPRQGGLGAHRTPPSVIPPVTLVSSVPVYE